MQQTIAKQQTNLVEDTMSFPFRHPKVPRLMSQHDNSQVGIPT